MSLKRYRIDLSSVSDAEHSRILLLLDKLAETGVYVGKEHHVYTCFFDEKVSVKEFHGLPAEVIQPIP